MSKINYFLITFILGFTLLGLFIQPVTYEAEIPSSFSEDISEIELNIPLDEDFIFDEIQILSDEKSSTFSGKVLVSLPQNQQSIA